jgi:ATP/maltotriose-dependent transcriptional regulator MalT/DNA-binding SARP family transcriptional activator
VAVAAPACSPKIARPLTLGVVPRERLFDRIEQAVAPVVWISGVPGAGKTTLVSSFVAARRLPCIWYQLDTGDTDPASFLHYLDLAVRRPPFKPGRLPLLPAEASPDLTAFARAYFRTLFGRLPGSTVLVLDNYQDAASPQFDTLLREAFAEVPDGVRVIVASLVAPPSSLARLVANQRITLIDAPELRFTREESDRAALQKLEFDEGALASLHALSGGWAAGLVLIAEHLRRSGRSRIAEPDRPQEAVFDYFASQVFALACKDDQRMLMLTSALPTFTAKVAEAASGHRDSARVLENLHRQHLFVDRRLDGEPIYQYHTLFRAFLSARAKHGLPPEVRSAAVSSAGRLAEAGTHPEDAVALYIDAGDWTSASRLILRCAASLYEQGRWRTLQDWIDAMPAETAESAPWLDYWAGACLVWHDASDALRRLESAYGRFVSSGDKAGQVLGASAMTRACILGADWSRLDRWIGVLESLLTGECDDLPAQTVLTGMSRLLYASFARRPEHPGLSTWADRTLEALLESTGDCNESVLAGFSLMNYYNWTGTTSAQALVVRHVQPSLSDARLSPVSLAYWKWGHAGFALRSGAVQEALTLVDESLLLARTNGLAIAAIIRRHRIGFLIAADQLALAEVELAALESEPRLEPYFENRSWLALLRGDMETALVEAETALRLATQRGRTYYRIHDLFLLAEICAESGAVEQALQHVREYRSLTAHLGGPLAEYRALLVEAYVALRQGDLAACHTQLGAALAIGAREHYVSHWGWSPKMMSRLYAEAFKADIAASHVREAVHGHNLLPESADVEIWPWPVKVYTLGRFELVVDGKTLHAQCKPQRKPIELAKILVAAGEGGFPVPKLIDFLWVNRLDGDGQKSMDITIHRLRKLLGSDAAVRVTDHTVALDPRRVWVDAWSLERILARCVPPLDGAKIPMASLELAADAVLDLFRGDFVSGDAEAIWQIPLRNRLAGRFQRFVSRLGQHWESRQEWDRALALYQRALELDPLAESFYRHEMICLRAQGRRAEAIEAFRRCRQSLSIVLGVAPTSETDQVYRQLLAS